MGNNVTGERPGYLDSPPTASQWEAFADLPPEAQEAMRAFRTSQESPQQQYQTFVSEKPYDRYADQMDRGRFDYTQEGYQPGDRTSGIAGVFSGPNTGDSNSEYIAWQTNGSGTFGIRQDGTKDTITRQQAVDMGFVPPPMQTGDFYDLGNTDTVPGGTPNPGTGGGGPPTGGIPNPPTGGGGGGGGGGWNWDYFGGAPPLDGGGGTDPGDYSFDRYVPGQESPWGIPEVEGGNQDFYRNQFVNLLEGDQEFQEQQGQAAEIRANAQPADPVDYDAMWRSMGVFPNQPAEADLDGNGNYTWGLGGNLTRGSSNADFVEAFQSDDQFSDADRQFFNDIVQPTTDGTKGLLNQYGWGRAGNPNDAISKVTSGGLDQTNQDRLAKIINLAYTPNYLTTPRGGGPTANPGYALPVGTAISTGEA